MFIRIVIIYRINCFNRISRNFAFNRSIVWNICLDIHFLSNVWSESECNPWRCGLWPCFLYIYWHILFEETCMLSIELLRIVFISKDTLHGHILFNWFRKERHITGFNLQGGWSFLRLYLLKIMNRSYLSWCLLIEWFSEWKFMYNVLIWKWHLQILLFLLDVWLLLRNIALILSFNKTIIIQIVENKCNCNWFLLLFLLLLRFYLFVLIKLFFSMN